MLFRKKKFLFPLIIFLALAFYQQLNPSGQILGENVDVGQVVRQEAEVLRIVDGDTIEVLLDDNKEKIRVIGINTPETVDPRRKPECFGKEASSRAKELLMGQKVYLESDPSQKNVDNYGRLLRYVVINNVDYGKSMINGGYAYEYTYDLPYEYQQEYKEAEKNARESEKGLWADNACAMGV